MTTQPGKAGLGLCATTLVVAAWSSASPALDNTSVAEPHAATPACIQVRAEARQSASGYDHWVFVDSDCDLPAACDISTDVHPESMTLAVQPRTTGSVLTATAASTSKFTPYVTCQLGPAD